VQPAVDPALLDIEDPAALLAYLRQAGHIARDETPALRTLAGGVSNRTVWVGRDSGEAWVLKQALAKLRVPVDWFSSPERVHREALALRWLPALAPTGAITPLVFEDHAAHLLAMQAVPEPHANWKTLLLAGRLESAHVAQFARLLAAIHVGAYARRAELAPIFADRTFFESLRLEPYYAYTATQAPAAAPFLDGLIAETRGQTVTIVHGDYSPKNVLVQSGRLILLDHEVIHWGDPAFDLGFSLTHLLSKANHLRAQRAAFAAAAQQYWRIYQAQSANQPWSGELEPRAVRHTLACLLARVAGRSPLEYLTPEARARQHTVVVALMAAPPHTMPDLVERFLHTLAALESDPTA
jgi:aminoglycoside phosphotransferase (APT) family kinase protein